MTLFTRKMAKIGSQTVQNFGERRTSISSTMSSSLEGSTTMETFENEGVNNQYFSPEKNSQKSTVGRVRKQKKLKRSGSMWESSMALGEKRDLSEKICNRCCVLCYYPKMPRICMLPTWIQKWCACNLCCFLILFMNIVALALTVSLTVHFFTQRGLFLADRRISVKKQISDMISERTEFFESKVRSLQGFFYGSKFVDYEEFILYSTVANICSRETSVDSISWYTTVPYTSKSGYEDYISTNAFMLPTEALEALNRTQPISTEDYLHVLTYSIPSLTKVGDKFTGTSLLNTLFSDYDRFEDNAESSINYKRLTYDSSNNVVLELYSPVKKSNLSVSLSPGFLNGFAVYTTDAVSIFENACLPLGDYIDCTVHLEISATDHICLLGCEDEDKFEYLEDGEKHISLIGIEYSDQYYSSTPNRIEVFIVPKPHFFVTNFDAPAYLALFLPFTISLSLSLMICFACYYFRNHLKAVDQLRVFEKVGLAISRMDFNDKFVTKLMKKRRKARTENILRRLVSVMKEFKTYMPQTLLERLSGDFEAMNTSDTSEDKKVVDEKKHNGMGRVLHRRSSSVRSIHGKNIDVESPSSLLDSVQQRVVLVMMIGVMNLDEIMRLYSFKKVFEMLGVFHTTVYEIMKKYRGNFHVFRGFRMMYSFGGVSVRVNPGMDAVRAAWEVTNHQKLRSMKVCVGLAKMFCFCGDLNVFDPNDGSVLLRQYDLVPCDPENDFTPDCVTTLLKLNREYDTRIICEQGLYDDVKHRVEGKLLDIVELQESGFCRTKKIYEVHKFANVKQDEWMYEIENAKGEHTDCFETIEKTWKYVSVGDINSALKTIEIFLREGNNRETFGKHFQRVNRVIEEFHFLDEEKKENYATVVKMI